MDSHLLLFASGTHFAHGSLPDCMAMTLRTGGLNGTIQPYQIYVADPQKDGPYEQRSKLTTNTQDSALYQKDKIFQEGKMISTEYTKGHGIASGSKDTTDDNINSTIGDSSNNARETVHVVHINPYIEKDNLEDNYFKMSKGEFDRKVAELDEQATKSGTKRSNNELEKSTKKKKTHKFHLC